MKKYIFFIKKIIKFKIKNKFELINKHEVSQKKNDFFWSSTNNSNK